jgi:hypothetical protein
MKWFTLQFDFGAADTTKTANFPTSIDAGICKLTKVKAPDFSGTPTHTIDVYDSVQDKIYTKASLVDNQITLVTDVFPIVPGGKCVWTATGAPGTAKTCYVTFFIFNQE